MLYGGHDPGVCCRFFRGLTLWHFGYPDRALDAVREGLSLARQLSHPILTVIALYGAALLHWLRGEPRAARNAIEAAIELAAAREAVAWLHTATTIRARLAGDEGDEGAVAQLEAAMARVMGWRRIVHLCHLAELCGQRGEVERGLTALAEARALADEGVGYMLPEVHRLRGELLLTRGPAATPEAEAAFRQAIEGARARRERSLKLRGAMSLACLLVQTGRPGEARRALGEAYRSFAEGLDTRDLREARRPLEELESGASP